jgi:hypothetical protein
LIVTCDPVAAERPATVFDEPLTLVSSSYLNFISDPVDVFTVIVFDFESTSVISPMATVEDCEEPSAGDEGLGDLGDCGDGALVDGGCCEGAPAAGPSCCARGACTPKAKTNASEARLTYTR